jgi:hypothetical protein
MRTWVQLLLGGVGTMLVVGATGTAPLHAQERRLPLEPISPDERSVVPFMEGWYENEDGSVTISFGYWNLNSDQVIEIPLGEANSIEPEQFDGLQPAVFFPGRQHGVFGVTVPASMRDTDVWWSITNASGEVMRVPGRSTAEAYQLDRRPRPHGSLPPLIWFEDESRAAIDPSGVVADGVLTTRVGEAVTLEAHVRDPSERDPDDPRLLNGVEVRAIWYKHQGPGEVTYSRHESMPEVAESQELQFGGLPGLLAAPVGPQQISLPEGEGPVRVYATFSEPGDYVMRLHANNWGAPDSNQMDQCCWTNAFVRVRVAP